MFTHRFDPESACDRVEGPGLDLAVRRLGAEVIGLARRLPDGDRIGLIWRDGEVADPPRFWKGHATVLFPIVGRLHGLASRTTDGKQVRFRKQHGFVRHSVVPLVSARGTDDGEGFELAYRLEANDETRPMYPFEFALTVTYTLRADRLDAAFAVENRGDRPLPFQVGWHPGFACPFRRRQGVAKAYCRLVLPDGPIDLLGNTEDCYLTGERTRIPGGRYAFDEPGLDRTYMLDLSGIPPAARVVSLTDPDGFGVRVRCPDFPHVGLWSDAGAPFLCIEPWQGMDDERVQVAFDRKFGMVLLPPGATDVRRASIEVL